VELYVTFGVALAHFGCCTADEFETRVDRGAVSQNAIVRQATQPARGRSSGVLDRQKRRRIIESGGPLG
jgi:hypothetical protein